MLNELSCESFFYRRGFTRRSFLIVIIAPGLIVFLAYQMWFFRLSSENRTFDRFVFLIQI